MADLVRVTVAPGCHITIAPHPSRIPGMLPLVLHAGNTADVTPARAADLFKSSLILDPLTGALPPPPQAADGLVRVSYGGRPFKDSSLLNVHPSWAETAAPPPEPRILAPAERPGPNPSIQFFNEPEGGPSITTADGRPWPNY